LTDGAEESQNGASGQLKQAMGKKKGKKKKKRRRRKRKH